MWRVMWKLVYCALSNTDIDRKERGIMATNSDNNKAELNIQSVQHVESINTSSAKTTLGVQKKTSLSKSLLPIFD